MAFSPRGAQPQWQVVYDHLITMKIGDVVTYEFLAQLLPDNDFESIRGIFHQAKKNVLRDIRRAFRNVRGVGYEMVHPREQEKLATGHETRARKQTRKALTLVTEVELGMLSDAEKRQVLRMAHHYRNLERFMKNLAQKHEKLEQRVSITEKDSASLADRIDEQAETINALKAMLEQRGFSTAPVQAKSAD